MGKVLFVAVIASASFVFGSMSASKVKSVENTAYAQVHDTCSKIPIATRR